MTISPDTQREVLNQLRTAMADLEAIEEECGGAHDLQLVIEVLLEIIRKLESSRTLTSWLQYRDVRRRAMDEHIDMVRKALERDLLAIEIVVFVVGSLDTLLDVTHAEFGNVGRYF